MTEKELSRYVEQGKEIRNLLNQMVDENQFDPKNKINLTDEQIRSRFSDPSVLRTWTLCKESPSHDSYKGIIQKNQWKTPSALDRLSQFLLDTSGTKEAEEKNATLYANINQPGETGKEARHKAFREMMNRITSLDLEGYRTMNQEEKLQYYVDHYADIQLAWESERVISNAIADGMEIPQEMQNRIFEVYSRNTFQEEQMFIAAHSDLNSFLIPPEMEEKVAIHTMTNGQLVQLTGNMFPSYANQIGMAETSKRQNQLLDQLKEANLFGKDAYDLYYFDKKGKQNPSYNIINHLLDGDGPWYAVKPGDKQCTEITYTDGNVNIKKVDFTPEITEIMTPINKVKALDDKIKELSTCDGHGMYPKFDEAGKQELVQLYNSAISELDHQGNREKSLAIAKELRILSQMDVTKGYTYPEAHYYAQTKVVDISNKELGKVGAMQSSRIPMTVTIDGKEVTGFFTKESKVDILKPFDTVVQNTKKAHPKMAEQIQTFVDRSLAYQAGKGVQNKEAQIGGFYQMFNKNITDVNTYLTAIGYTQEEIQALPEDMADAFETFNHNLIVNNGGQAITYGYFLGLKDGSNIDERNSAMSEVADMLGISSLLAKSLPMKVMNNGQITDGTFMAFAEGSDLSNLKSTDPIFTYDKDVYASNGLKNQADLQILDFICMNIDRHDANMMYNFTDGPNGPKFSHTIGIDNDCSFGLNPAGNELISKLPPLEHMKVISSSMVQKLNQMDENVFKAKLGGYKLSGPEIDAAWIRLQQVKTAAKDGTLQVVPDHKFKDLNLLSLCKHNGRIIENRFVPLYAMKDTLEDNNDLEQAKQREANELVNPKKPIQKVETLVEIGQESIRQDSNLIANIQKSLDKVDPSYVRSSKAFREMRKAINALQKFNTALERSQDPRDPMLDLRREALYNNVREKAEQYLNYKNRQMLKGKKMNDRAQSRIKAVEVIKSFCIKKRDAIHQAQELDTIAINKLGNAEIQKIKTLMTLETEHTSKYQDRVNGKIPGQLTPEQLQLEKEKLQKDFATIQEIADSYPTSHSNHIIAQKAMKSLLTDGNHLLENNGGGKLMEDVLGGAEAIHTVNRIEERANEALQAMKKQNAPAIQSQEKAAHPVVAGKDGQGPKIPQ